MELSGTVSASQIQGIDGGQVSPGKPNSIQDRVYSIGYAILLAVSFSVWFIAIHAPLWLDETVTFSVISRGFGQIIARQGGLASPTYYYILLLWTKIAGTSEIALRIPSILAMLAASYLVYLAARELFDRDAALIAAVVFSAHPYIIFESIDTRPYAFGALAVSLAILLLVRLRNSDSNLLAGSFGAASAVIVYFQLLFGAILPALAFCFVVLKMRNRKTFLQQFTVAFASFTLAFLPVIPGLLFIFRTKGSHVFDAPPKLLDLAWTLAPGFLIHALVITALVAAASRKIDLSNRIGISRVLLCTSLALVPLLILFGLSIFTPLHIFVARYQLVAIPGIALLWGSILNRIDSRLIRLLFCAAVVSSSAYYYFHAPSSTIHGYTWKYALEIAEKNASTDNAAVVICSDLVEADHMPMPIGEAVKDSPLFSPLSYYKLSVPVVGLPRALNDEAKRVGTGFVREAARRQERFLALAYFPSYDTLRWLASAASETHEVRLLGQNNDIMILEFTPRAQPGTPHLP